jgi:hypothetical protein
MTLAKAAQRNKKPDTTGMDKGKNFAQGPYKPIINLAAEWPEVFIKQIAPRKPVSKWDRGPVDEEVTIFKDPREDLAAENPEESYRWGWLLAEAWPVSRELAITLHGFRCMGTRLMRSDTGFAMKPEVSAKGWQSQEEYKQARDGYLVPHREKLTRLLRQLG